MTGKRCRFRRNSLHQTTISTNGVDVVVENLEAGFIEAAGEPLLADGHADAGGNALAQWTSRGLDALRPSGTRGDQAPCCRAVGNVGCRRALRKVLPIFRIRHSLHTCESDEVPTIATSKHGRSIARSDHDWARSDLADRIALLDSRACIPAAPGPSVCRDVQTWLAALRQSKVCEWC
jgi:hypothetical protein